MTLYVRITGCSRPATTESADGHVKNAVADALLIRGVVEFDELASYRRFTNEIVSRKNAHHAKR